MRIAITLFVIVAIALVGVFQFHVPSYIAGLASAIVVVFIAYKSGFLR